MTSRRHRLVHVTTTDMSLALLLAPQLHAFERAGYEVITMSAPGPYTGDLHKQGLQHESIAHLTRRMAPQADLRAFFELRRAFRRLQPDIVHTHNPKPGVFGRIAARSARVPGIVNTVHGLYALPQDRAAKRLTVYTLERVAARCSGAELVQNEEDIPVLASLGITAPKVRLLGNGIDLTKFAAARVQAMRAEARAELGIADNRVVVGVVGRLVVEKGYRELFTAARELAASDPNVTFLVVGPRDDDKHDALSNTELEHVEKEANIALVGERRDVDRMYAAMDVFALPSWREGFSRSGMEAAACGLPVIATDVRGCRQVVDHDVTGLLVPVRRPDALATAVRRVVRDHDLRVRMGAAGVAKAHREFDQQRVIDITLTAYDDVLRGQRHG